VQAIYDRVEHRDTRYELNLYISGEDEPAGGPEGAGESEHASSSEGAEGSAA
jgi:hypothetical protein